MSSVVSVERQRWAAREMVVRRWLVQPNSQFRRGDALCELEIDGRLSTIPADIHREDVGNTYWHFVDVGEEVRINGQLLEYSDSGFTAPENRRPTAGRRRPLNRRPVYPRIFINYRRDDSEAYAGRLHQTLSTVFGADDVFMDQFSIFPGEDFAWTIQQAVSHAAVVVCVIGPRWLEVKGDPPSRRIDEYGDLLRLEMTAALDRGTPVIPLIVPRGAIPEARDLPAQLRDLVDLQMLEISARHWDADVERLVVEIRRCLPPTAGGA